MADHALVVDGLLQLAGGSDSVFFFSTSEYDEKLWRLAEQKLAELVHGIQPCSSSEDSRRAVINYVEGLIKRNFHCKVFPYGSVPLKTYLPHGDIDLTAISNCHSSNATWAKEMCAILEKEEHTHNAGFKVKEVIPICAKVPVVKCLVENIIVDISFNQLGGLSTLCFLEEVDRLIGQNHLFKRSIILVKAWCFYESRVLGAQYGLLCTYALDTLVLFVFNVFHRSLRGPLEVLFCFLKFFSKFDWNRYCLSIRGPIPLLSLHKMSAESFQDLNGQFLLSDAFLSACRGKHSVCFEGNQGNTFNQKFMNIVDPLHPDNNLGHSVNRGSFVRIQSAFAYGARQLEKLLHSTSHVTFVGRLDAFFQNTYKLCRGRSPDASSGFELCQQVNASVCDEEAASSESANTEVTAETAVTEHAQLWPSCNGTQVQRAFVIDDGELYLRPDRISKCIRNKNLCKFLRVLDLTVLFDGDDDETHKADGITLFGEDPGRCSFQDLKPSCKRLEKWKAAASSSSRNLCRLLAGPTRRLDRFLYITMNYLASATGLVKGDNSLCNHVFYNILKRKTQSEALRSSIFRYTFSLVPWLLSKIDIQEGRNSCMVHLGMQPEEHSSHPIICYKSRYLFPSGLQASLLQEDHDLHHQFAGLSNQTEVDILRGDLATYLLNLEAGRCTPMSCLQEPLPHASRTNICSLPVEQDSALEGLGRPEAEAPPISYLHAMPMSDHFGFPKSCKGTGAFYPNLVCLEQDSALEGLGRPEAEAPPISYLHAMPMMNHSGFPKSCKGTGAFFPNLVPGFDSDKQWTNGTRGRGRVKKSKKRSKMNLKAKKQEKTLLMEGPVHEDLLNSPNKGVTIGGFSGMAINISNWSLRPPAAVVVHFDNKSLPVEMLQFGSINPGLLAGSFLDPSIWSQHACSPGRGGPELCSRRGMFLFE